MEDDVQVSEEAWSRKDAGFFYRHLPASDRWRVFQDFSHRFAAVDIETTGLSSYAGITVVGIQYNGEYRAFINGINLADAVPMLESAFGLITFNGARFDLPFLKRAFPSLRLPSAHLDLRFLARRVGLTGGLKHVEALLGFDRSDTVNTIDGYGAVVLWNQYLRGDDGALEQLVRYNAADTCVLHPLCEIIVHRLKEKLGSPHVMPPVRRSGRRDQNSDSAPCVEHSRRTVSLDDSLYHPRRSCLGMTEGEDGRRRSIALPECRRVPSRPTIDVVLRRMPNPSSRIVGVDLSGSDARRTGWACLQGEKVITKRLRLTSDIIHETIMCGPDLVSIDAPLTLPAGRCCFSDACECHRYGISRLCERMLRERGVGVYWGLLPSMQALTKRGIAVAQAFKQEGIPVIESFPGAAQDILHIPRKRKSLAQLYNGLVCLGVRDLAPLKTITHDELDAVTSAIVGAFYLANLHEALGTSKEGYLIVPILPTHA